MIGQNCGQTRIDWKIRELCTFCACSTDDKPQQERKVAGVKYNLYCSSWGELVSVALKIALRNQRSDVRLVSGAFEEWIAELALPLFSIAHFGGSLYNLLLRRIISSAVLQVEVSMRTIF